MRRIFFSFVFISALFSQITQAGRQEWLSSELQFKSIGECPSAQFWLTSLVSGPKILEVEFEPSTVGRWKGKELRFECLFSVVLPIRAGYQRRLSQARAMGAVGIDTKEQSSTPILRSQFSLRGLGLPNKIKQDSHSTSELSQRREWLRLIPEPESSWMSCGQQTPIIAEMRFDTQDGEKTLIRGFSQLRLGSSEAKARFQFLLEEQPCNP